MSKDYGLKMIGPYFTAHINSDRNSDMQIGRNHLFYTDASYIMIYKITAANAGRAASLGSIGGYCRIVRSPALLYKT